MSQHSVEMVKTLECTLHDIARAVSLHFKYNATLVLQDVYCTNVQSFLFLKLYIDIVHNYTINITIHTVINCSSSTLYSAQLYCTVLYYTVLFCILLYCTARLFDIVHIVLIYYLVAFLSKDVVIKIF